MKYIAIVLVIITHANGAGPDAFRGIPILSNLNITSAFCEGGMALLLVLSGYGISASLVSKGIEGFWTKRIVYILIPASIIQILYTIFCIL